MDKQTTIIVGCIVVVIIAFVAYKWATNKEGFQIAMGMIHPQNKFYSKCVDDCFRQMTGDSSPGQFKWFCTDHCQDKANKRMIAGLPDLTDVEFERHTGPRPGQGVCSNSTTNPTPSEECFCLQERKEWCKQQWCPFSNDPLCVPDCLRTRAVNCTSMSGGGLIM